MSPVLESWETLLAFSDTFTCYSSALASWIAHGTERWPDLLNPGLALVVVDAGAGRFGFSHFPSRLRGELGLERTGAEGPDPGQALEGVLAELELSGRVIVAADGFHLPWHVAHGRRHVPHWFVLTGTPDRLLVTDPFSARNELGVQEPALRQVDREELTGLLPALPREDRILAMREVYAFGDETPPDERPWQWFVRGAPEPGPAPAGASGPDAVRVLAEHFRLHGQLRDAYAQADDIWSIARHRAFLARWAAQSGAELAQWAAEQAEPLAKRWAHLAPLIMQATLTLASGRSASASVPDTLEELAEREATAAQTFPGPVGPGSI